MARGRSVSRLKAVPWLLLFEGARLLRAHLDSLTPKERRRVAEILRASRGNPQRVTPAERAELRRLAGKLDMPRLARDLMGLRARRRRR
jgi:hypothetical protein